MGRRRIRPGGLLTLVILTLPCVVLTAAWLERPVLAYATSGSMEPTIGTGDAYLANPLARNHRPGDVVIFQAVTYEGLAVHRLVERTPEGWITKGDANPFSDQEAGEPPVSDRAIRARVLAWPDGSPVTVPLVGSAVVHVQILVRTVQLETGTNAWILGAGAVLLGVATMAPAARARVRAARDGIGALRRARRPRFSLLGARGRLLQALGVVVILASAGFAASMSQEEVPLTLVVADSVPPGSARTTLAGGTLPRTLEVQGMPGIPTYVLIEETPRIRLAEDAPRIQFARGSTPVRFDVWQEAGEEHGLQHDVVRVARYPTVLPPSAVLALHELAPGALHLLLGVVAASVVAPGTARSLGAPRPKKAPPQPEVRP